jgi:hypothetical protein
MQRDVRCWRKQTYPLRSLREPLPGSLVTVISPPIIGRKRLPTRVATLAPVTGNPNEALAQERAARRGG